MNRNKRRSITVGHKRRSLNRSLVRNQSSSNLNNLIDSANGSCIKVVVRARPLSKKEEGKGPEVIAVVDEKMLVFDPVREQEEFFFQGQKQTLRDLNKKVNKNVNFIFDRVYDGSSSNELIFTESIQSIIGNLLSGFNCSVFAYGATGAGKTFTMLGSKTTPGLIYLIVKDLFQKVEEMTGKISEIKVSYLEVYNESVKDLLHPSSPLTVCDDSRGVMVAGLAFQKPTNADDLLRMLHFGNQIRTQHPTDANAESSRSHAVFQIYLRIKDRVGGLTEHVQLSKMSLIDLAGSERASAALNHGKARQREGSNINQSLLALGSCINALADKTGKPGHIPYRNSKLTRILKDSLGGNCKTVMIAAIGPASSTYEDTYNTLKYAERAKGIKTCLKRNLANVDVHLLGYKNIVENLTAENKSLKRKLELADQELQAAKYRKLETSHVAVQADLSNPSYSQNQMAFSADPTFRSETASSQVINPEWKMTVDAVCQQQAKLRNDVLSQERLIKSSRATFFWRKLAHERMANLTADIDIVTRSQNKLDTCAKSLQAKEERLMDQNSKLLERLNENVGFLNHLWGSASSEHAKMYAEKQRADLEIMALRAQISHAVETSSFNLFQTLSAWKCSEKAMLIARKQQIILNGRKYLTSDLVQEYDSLLKQAKCGREVAWADNPSIQNPFHLQFLDHLLLPSAGYSHPLSQSGHQAQALVFPEPCLTTYHSPYSVESVAPHFSESPPGTPGRTNQVSSSTIMTPPRPHSVLLSPGPQGRDYRSIVYSPHPKRLDSVQLSTQALLDMVNAQEEPQFVRRSLEDKFTPSTSRHVPQMWDQPYPPSLPDLEAADRTCSPASFQGILSRPQYTSTPSMDRPRMFLTGNFEDPSNRAPMMIPSLPSGFSTPPTAEPEHREQFLERFEASGQRLLSCVSAGLQQQSSMHQKMSNHNAGGDILGISYTVEVPSSSTTVAMAMDHRPSPYHLPTSQSTALCPSTITRPSKLNITRPIDQVGTVNPMPRFARTMSRGPQSHFPSSDIRMPTASTVNAQPKSSTFYRKSKKENAEPSLAVPSQAPSKKPVPGVQSKLPSVVTARQRSDVRKTKTTTLRPLNK